ncbi:MAG TPA: DLW-39 family protein [Actinotalea sp.]|nr:DLW-39 family protein [Actinotalea sp.]
MKKLLIALIALVGLVVGYAVWRTYAEDRDERDLWTEVTDELD